MSNLSELLPAGAGAKSADFVASGTLGSGVTVALKADGTVSVVAETSGTATLASSSVFESATTYGSAASYSPTLDRFVIIYSDNGNGNYPTCQAGYVNSSGVFTFGTPVVIESQGSVTNTQCCEFHPPSGKFILIWSTSPSTRGVVATVSGTSISLGAPLTFLGSPCSAYSVDTTYSTSAERVFYVGNISGNLYGARITVSGTNTFQATGAGIVVASDGYGTVCYDSDTDQCIVGYRISSSSFGVVPVAVTPSSTTVGTAATASSGSAAYHAISYDTSAQKALISFVDFTNSDTRAAVVSISGTTSSLGTLTQLTTDNIEYGSCIYLPTEKVNVIIGRNEDTVDKSLSVMSVTINGTTPSTTGPEEISANTRDGGVTYDSTNGYILGFYRGPSDYGTAYSFTPTYSLTNNTDFIGITDQAIADTATGAVIVQGGVSEKAIGLTTGSDYYVQSDGTISTTVSSVPAGRALSSTSILLEG